MYFDRVYSDADAMTLVKADRTVSSLLLQRYAMTFHGIRLPVGYISGAATRRAARSKGYMTELMLEALDAARQRGDMAVTLIPASEWLYDFYARMDFAAVFYVDAERYTSLHKFPADEGFHEVADIYSEAVTDAFARLELTRRCAVVHTRRDFLNILDDLRISHGVFTAVARDGESAPAAMAWAAPDDENSRLIVKELMGIDASAREAALHAVRRHFPDMPVTVLAVPGEGNGRRLTPRGMMRIVNPMMALQAVAASHPDLSLAIRLTDQLMPINSHTYIISGGECTVDDDYTGKTDFDIDANILCRIMFSSAAIGEITGFPSIRPHISLMLD